MAQQATERSDAELLNQARTGDQAAFFELWVRHEPFAQRAAGGLVRNSHDGEDLVATVRDRIWRALANGNGPTVAFRAYLCTTLRNSATDLYRRAPVPTSDIRELGEAEPAEGRDLEGEEVVRQAFARLSERHQEVLALSEVGQLGAAQVGEHLGLSANAAAQLAHRARRALRYAWIDAHMARRGSAPVACTRTCLLLRRLVAGDASAEERDRIEEHLAGCEECRAAYATALDSDLQRRGLALLLLGPSGAAWLAHRPRRGLRRSHRTRPSPRRLGLATRTLVVAAAASTLAVGLATDAPSNGRIVAGRTDRIGELAADTSPRTSSGLAGGEGWVGTDATASVPASIPAPNRESTASVADGVAAGATTAESGRAAGASASSDDEGNAAGSGTTADFGRTPGAAVPGATRATPSRPMPSGTMHDPAGPLAPPAEPGLPLVLPDPPVVQGPAAPALAGDFARVETIEGRVGIVSAAAVSMDLGPCPAPWSVLGRLTVAYPQAPTWTRQLLTWSGTGTPVTDVFVNGVATQATHVDQAVLPTVAGQAPVPVWQATAEVPRASGDTYYVAGMGFGGSGPACPTDGVIGGVSLLGIYRSDALPEGVLSLATGLVPVSSARAAGARMVPSTTGQTSSLLTLTTGGTASVGGGEAVRWGTGSLTSGGSIHVGGPGGYDAQRRSVQGAPLPVAVTSGADVVLASAVAVLAQR